MPRRVLVTGAGGQLARTLVQAFSADADVLALARADLDITDDASVDAALASARPDVIINCASDNDVDAAQEHPVRAIEVNAFGVRVLARAADSLGAILIHYSSDFVFDGRTDHPYRETDKPNPQSVYAASKLLGEWFALEARHAFVLRVESLFGAAPRAGGHRSSLDKIVNAIEAGDEVPVFCDRTVSPSYVHDIAAATDRLIEMGAEPGLYHCVNTGTGRWDDIAREAARLLGREPRLRLITLDQVALRAPRPKYCALDNSCLAALGIVMPTWQDALARHITSRTATETRTR